MHREPLRDDAYWQEWIPIAQEDIETRTAKLNTVPFPEKWKKNAIAQNLYYDCYNLIRLQYSGGIGLEEIAQNYGQLIDAWVAYNQNISSGDNKKHLLITNDYYRVLTIISWGICFNAPVDSFERIVRHLHTNGDDALVETLLSSRLIGRTQTKRIIFPKPFDWLYQATQATGNQQISLIKKYLSNWYPNMKKFINYDVHKSKGDGVFNGYWSFEAAAVVALNNIDDSSFRDMDFYPRDLADYGKETLKGKV